MHQREKPVVVAIFQHRYTLEKGTVDIAIEDLDGMVYLSAGKS